MSIEKIEDHVTAGYLTPWETIRRYRPFLTGSRAYGSPRDDSDIDLVILAPNEIMYLLCMFGDHHAGPEDDFYEMGAGSVDPFPSASVSFGQLNLIIHTSTEKYDAWQDATRELITMAEETGEAVKRETAVELIKSKLAKLGI